MRPCDTVEAIVEPFVRVMRVERDLSDFTLRYYAVWVRRWLAFLARYQKPWQQAAREDAVAYKMELIESGNYRAEAIRQALVSGRSLYEWATWEGLFVGRNPFAGLRAPRPARTVKLALSEEQVIRMFDRDWPSDFRGLRDRAIVAVLYGCGLRHNECRMLDVRDVDLSQGLLAVNHGKGGSNGTLVMPAYTVRALREYLEAARPTVCPRSDGPLFVGPRGDRISYVAVATAVDAVARRIDRHVTCHDLRRSAATHLLQRGANIAEVQRFLRHVSLRSTQWYLGISGQHVHRAVMLYHPLSRLGEEGRNAPAQA